MFRVSTEWILGVRPEWDGLRIAPCLPPHWKGFRMTRRFRGSVYDIRVGQGARRERVLVDGREHDGRLIPAFGDGKRHTVVVQLTDRVARAAAGHEGRTRASRRTAAKADGGVRVAVHRATGEDATGTAERRANVDRAPRDSAPGAAPRRATA